MSDNGFRKTYENKSTNELLDIVTNKRDDYNKNAITDIEMILNDREVAYEIMVPEPTVEVEKTEKSDNKKLIYWPLVVGFIFVGFSFLNPFESSSDAFTKNLIALLITRFIVLVWVIDLAKQYSFKQSLWAILGLIFGGWILMIMNILIWNKPDLTESDMDNGE